MKMSRSELLSKLKTCQPAISSKDFSAAFSCFCFDGERLHTFDDFVGIVLPFKTDFVGGLRGAVFYDWLNVSRAEEVDVIQKQGEEIVKVTAGKANLDLPIIPKDKFVFSLPDRPGEELKVGDDFLAALAKVQVSIGTDPQRPWQFGVTLEFSRNDTVLYSTDNISATRSTVAGKTIVSNPLILQPRFCDLLRSMSAKSKLVSLRFGDGWVIATFESGVMLYAKTSTEVDLAQYKAMFGSPNFETCKKNAVDTPKVLKNSMERLRVALIGTSFPLILAKIEGGTMLVEAKNETIYANDQIKMETHPDSKFEISPVAVLKGMDFATKFGVDDTACAAFLGDNYDHIIAIARE